MKQLFINIRQLVGVQQPAQPLRGEALGQLPLLENAYLQVVDGRIAGFGAMQEVTTDMLHEASNIIDAAGRLLLPGFVDSHTHLVFAGTREAEFVLKLQGASYAAIAAAGGGIHSTAAKVQAASEDALYEAAWQRLQALMKTGTTAIEIKSGYGLTLEAELKMLRVIQRLKQTAPIPIKATFLGAHALPKNFADNRDAFVDVLIQQWLPKVADEGLADFVDVFCEAGFFTTEETIRIARAAAALWMPAKLHVNQLQVSGGVQAAVAVNALSADHLECMDEAAIQTLAGSNTIGTMLPTAAFFLRLPYPQARQLIAAGSALALASDYNPGSSPSGYMQWVLALACIQMKMTPAEAINAMTINAAFALQLEEEVGSIAVGKRANLLLTKPMSSVDYMAYAFGEQHIEQVYVNGLPV